MNKKTSGCQSILVSITKVGKNYLPYVENLRNRHIKFIDAYGSEYLPGTSVEGVTDFSDAYITIADKVGNSNLILDLPLYRLNYITTYGQRQQIDSEISLSNSYITITDEDQVGKAICLVVWYDLPEYSRSNKSDDVRIDGLSVPITTATFQNNLPDSLTMSGKRFRQILFEPTGTTPDFRTGVTLLESFDLYLTLRKGSYNVMENVPLVLLYQMWQADKILFANIIFDFQSSYITVGGAGTNQVAPIGKSVYLNFMYEN